MTKVSPARVLLLEDDAWFGESLRATITQRGNYDIRLEHDPAQVFDIIDSWTPQVMVTDLHLGSRNCLTLLNEMASYPDTLALAKVILSLSGHSLDAEDMRRYGVIKVLDKMTYNINDIIQTIEEAVADPWRPV